MCDVDVEEDLLVQAPQAGYYRLGLSPWSGSSTSAHSGADAGEYPRVFGDVDGSV
jgi:hypothetical protein